MSLLTSDPGAAGRAIEYARAQIGKPYQWGATGPGSFDCSGLVMMAYQTAGVPLTRTTYTQILQGDPVDQAGLAPGDLVFPDAGHVQLYVGGGQVIEAPHTGASVQQVAMWGFWQARRVAPPASGADAGAVATLTSNIGGGSSSGGSSSSGGYPYPTDVDIATLYEYGPAALAAPSAGAQLTGAGPLPIPGSLWSIIAGVAKGKNPVTSTISGVDDLAHAVKIGVGLLAWLTKPANWLRAAEIGAGAYLMAVGLMLFYNELFPGASQTAQKLAGGIATGKAGAAAPALGAAQKAKESATAQALKAGQALKEPKPRTDADKFIAAKGRGRARALEAGPFTDADAKVSHAFKEL